MWSVLLQLAVPTVARAIMAQRPMGFSPPVTQRIGDGGGGFAAIGYTRGPGGIGIIPSWWSSANPVKVRRTSGTEDWMRQCWLRSGGEVALV